MEAWCTDHHYLYIDVNGNGLLPVEAENQGKLVITTELGGGGRTPAPIHKLAWSGLNNVLRHVGVCKGEVLTRASLGLPPAVIIDGRDPRNIVVSPEDGMFEAMLEPGERVAAGQPVGRLWFMDRPDRPAELLRSPSDGIVVVTKAIPITEQGDCVFVVGTPIAREALL
jgi:N-alpha-acetyl-L-2,4-diaminobutyrate deacetylase